MYWTFSSEQAKWLMNQWNIDRTRAVSELLCERTRGSWCPRSHPGSLNPWSPCCRCSCLEAVPIRRCLRNSTKQISVIVDPWIKFSNYFTSTMTSHPYPLTAVASAWKWGKGSEGPLFEQLPYAWAWAKHMPTPILCMKPWLPSVVLPCLTDHVINPWSSSQHSVKFSLIAIQWTVQSWYCSGIYSTYFDVVVPCLPVDWHGMA